MGELHDALVQMRTSGLWPDCGVKDTEKVDAELKGERRPTAGSKYAQGFIRLARLDPPKVTIPPPPTSALNPFWQRDGVFTRSLSSFHGDLRNAARAAGFSVIYVQLDNTQDAAGNINELHLIGAQLMSEGWKLAGWSTAGQGTNNPELEGAKHANIRRSLDAYLDGWIANLEIWAEGPDQWKSQAWLQGWANGGGFGPCAVSCMSSDNPNFARSFDYKTWLSIPGAAVMPQCYGASAVAYTVQNCVSTMKNGGVNQNRLNITFDVIAGTAPYADYKKWSGPRSIYTGEDTTLASWAALAR